MAATKDTVNNRIQLNEGTRASPKTLAQVVTDINDSSWIESLQNGAVIVVKRSIWFNGFWLEYSNYVDAVFEDACHAMLHTSGSGVIHRPYSKWFTKQTVVYNPDRPEALRTGTTFVTEIDKDGAKPLIRSSGNRYDYPSTFDSGAGYHSSVKYEIAGLTLSATTNIYGGNYHKLLGATGSIFSGMTFKDYCIFEVFPGNTYNDLRSDVSYPSYLFNGTSGDIFIKRWRINSSNNYPMGGFVGWWYTCTVYIDDLANDGAGVWNGTFGYAGQINNITTVLRHSVNYTFNLGTTPISGVKVAIVNTATTGTAQAQTVITSNSSGLAGGFGVRAQGNANTVSLRQKQSIFARSLTHNVPHVQLALQELTAPVVTPVQCTVNALYGATETVVSNQLTKCSFNYSTKVITVTQSITAAELYDSARWSLYQDANISQTDFTTASTVAVRSFGDWVVTPMNGAVVTGDDVDAEKVGSIAITGVNPTDTVEVRRFDNNIVISTRTGVGSFNVSPVLVGVSVYFVRLSGSNIVMSTILSPVVLATGVNPEVPLFAGAQVQIAQAARIDLLPTLAQMEVVGGKIDLTLKAARAAKRQTL